MVTRHQAGTALKTVGYLVVAAIIIAAEVWASSKWGFWSWQAFAVVLVGVPVAMAVVGAIVAALAVWVGADLE